MSTRIKFHSICHLTIMLSFALSLSAQSGKGTRSTPDTPVLRSELAFIVSQDAGKYGEVLARLRAYPNPSGLPLDPEASFAFAAIDVGQRLIAAGKLAAAEKFFQEAEKSLEQTIKKTPDASAREKSILLQKLALIRANYLNKRTKAKEDLAKAMSLRPDDKYLKELSGVLANDQDEHVRKSGRG